MSYAWRNLKKVLNGKLGRNGGNLWGLVNRGLRDEFWMN
jgi:hypothetical protein